MTDTCAEILKDIRVYYADNDAGGKTMCYKYDDVIAAMSEHTSLQTTELRERVERLEEELREMMAEYFETVRSYYTNECKLSGQKAVEEIEKLPTYSNAKQLLNR